MKRDVAALKELLVGSVAHADCLPIEYRLAPEHPHPAALDDALAAYRWLLGQVGSPTGIVVAGDSAGGGLAVALLLALKDAGDPQPAAAVLLSPWLDLELTGDSVRSRRKADASLTEKILQVYVDAYARDHALTDPLVSPLQGDLAGMAPLLVQVGDAELLLDDSVRLVARATAAGVAATLEVWPEMPHVFQSFAGSLSEADEAIEHIGTWIRSTVQP